MPNFVVLYQYSHLGERFHGLNMMISIGGHFVFIFLMSEPQHLGHCYFLIQHNPLRLGKLSTEISNNCSKGNIIFEVIKLSVKNGGHFDFEFCLTKLKLPAWKDFSSSPYLN